MKQKKTEPILEAGAFQKQDCVDPDHKARPGQVMPGMNDVNVERMTGAFTASAPDKPSAKPKPKKKGKPKPKRAPKKKSGKGKDRGKRRGKKK